VDLDVHHGDGVQALHAADPGVLTVSIHESGRSLFPGTGFLDELGEGTAAGTCVNVPLEPLSGPEAWLAAVRSVVPALAAAFGPDVVVSQHGADGHVWDPLAHLSLTTTAMGEAARLVDRMAHRYAGGRWLSTGGGGYAVYRVVPRAWALTWLAAAHREAPRLLPEDWRARWAGNAARWGDSPLPTGFEDDAGLSAERSLDPAAAERDERTVSLVRTVMVPALLRVAEREGWWRFDGEGRSSSTSAAPAAEAPPAVAGAASTVVALTSQLLDRVTLAARTIAPADAADGLALLRAAVRGGAIATGASIGDWLVGVALAAPGPPDGEDELVALGVAPGWRRRGIANALLRAIVEEQDRRGRALGVLHTAADRDPFEPLPRELRRGVATRLLRACGFGMRPTPSDVAAADPYSLSAVHYAPDPRPAPHDR
jgi:GNAT superfamily N-acetyltransferase